MMTSSNIFPNSINHKIKEKMTRFPTGTSSISYNKEFKGKLTIHLE